jgi:hypothetical protein
MFRLTIAWCSIVVSLHSCLVGCRNDDAAHAGYLVVITGLHDLRSLSLYTGIINVTQLNT